VGAARGVVAGFPGALVVRACWLAVLILLVGGCAARPTGWTAPKDGSVLVYVPPGPFRMGCDVGEVDERPVHEVALPGYWIGVTPVSNAQFARFLNESGYRWKGPFSRPAEVVRRGGAYEPAAGRERFPVCGVSWQDARAYVSWAGLRLPTEAEWEKAARGTDGRTYPWGNAWEERRANAAAAPLGGPEFAQAPRTSPLDAHPEGRSPYGCLDMAGNVWEHTASLYVRYPYNPADGRENPEGDGPRVIRGGAWNIGADYARTSNRFRLIPSLARQDWHAARSTGLRVAATSPQAPAPASTQPVVAQAAHPPYLVLGQLPVAPASPAPSAESSMGILGLPITAQREARYDVPEERLLELTHPDRDYNTRPAEVVAALRCKPGDTVADIGAGAGYFTRRLGRAVGPRGQVWATDISVSALRWLQRRRDSEHD